MADDIQAVKDLEARRCEAIGKGDLDPLADTLADDYHHILGGGSTNDKTAYIDTIRRGPRVPERGDLTVRLYGDTAVMTGDIINRISYPGRPLQTIHAVVAQVAVKQADGKWRFVNFQITTKRVENATA